jgi:hypothetical protein
MLRFNPKKRKEALLATEASRRKQLKPAPATLPIDRVRTIKNTLLSQLRLVTSDVSTVASAQPRSLKLSKIESVYSRKTQTTRFRISLFIFLRTSTAVTLAQRRTESKCRA